MMKTVIVLSAVVILGIQAQTGGKTSGAKAGGAKGGNSGIMSALGSIYGEKGVPYGPAPKGCSTYEVLFG
jgi:hypothetical protein